MMSIAPLTCIVIVVCASWFDLRTGRLPNLLTLGAAGAGWMFHLLAGGPAGILSSALGFVLGLVLFLPLFALRGMGAGDVKLLAAVGAWLGPMGVLWTAAYAAIAGGALAVVVALARGYLRTAFANVWGLLCYWSVMGVRPVDGMTLTTVQGPRLPYAVPIAAGTVLTLWLH